MKKTLLIAAAGIISLGSNAQQKSMTSVVATGRNLPASLQKNYARPQKAATANKTTAAPTRTYDYGFLFDTTMNDNYTIGTSFGAPIMWQSNNMFGGYTSGYDTINMVSAGIIFDPSTPGFNDPLYFNGEMKITNSDAYTVNKVTVFGVYNYNPAHTTGVDTLILSFVKGKGGSPSTDDVFTNGYLISSFYDTVHILTMRYDTTDLNMAMSGSTAMGTLGTNVIKIPLDNSGATPAWGDTTADGIWSKTIDLSTTSMGDFIASAGDMIGMSMSFKNGTFSSPWDTVFRMDGTFKYNTWRPLTIYAADGSGAVQYAPHIATDSNEGVYKTLPHNANGWSYVYVPQWAFTDGSGGPSTLQYPYVVWDLTCATCGDITDTKVSGVVATSTAVNVYPNPANNEVKFNFNANANSTVTVVLTNMLGQVVAQSTQTGARGTATFNTSALPSGIYSYNVLVDGNRTTGRVTVAH